MNSIIEVYVTEHNDIMKCYSNIITIWRTSAIEVTALLKDLGPVVQSVVSLTSSLRVVSLTVLADSIHNILIFFAEKM